ncbi:hypothetical protein RDV78_04200 [Bacillota bacterium LX-D]|nr:hypothetical protein [Bacillota bacterium LX-D]
MLYFLSEQEHNHYFRIFNQAVRRGLTENKVVFQEIPLSSPSFSKPNLHILSQLKPTPEDCWLLASAHTPIIHYLAEKPGIKLGHVHFLEAAPYEGLRLLGLSLNELKYFQLFDSLFVNSQRAQDLLAAKYPSLAAKVIITGFPYDEEKLRPYENTRKDEGSIVFTQSFSLANLHILEVYLSD